jgi:two-component system response regulator PilR (NtrC family)
MSRGRILVVDDEPSIREMLTILLEGQGFDVTTAQTVSEGKNALGAGRHAVVMCDLKLPDGSGLEVLRHGRSLPEVPPFIIITAHTTPQHAMEALRAGAAEYLSKPFDVEELKMILDRLVPPSEDDREPYEESRFIGSSPAIRKIIDLIPRIAATPSTVLISGESGTGKELLARSIHDASPRAEEPFQSVNCGALPEGILESELFGHVKGSFTGAIRDHAGLFTQAGHGTIFLDEVGEMTASTQVKLLRVLQERRLRPVGGSGELDVHARVISATNRDLREEIRSGRFREDLFYRLNVVDIRLPPLRQRAADVPELARFFVERCCTRFGVSPKRISSDALRVLQAHAWPGNVRELENVIERTVALEQGTLITSGSLPSMTGDGAIGASAPAEHVLPEEGLDLEEYLSGLRASLMSRALERTDGHQKKAAELLRLSYRAFRYHADKLGLVHADED